MTTGSILAMLRQADGKLLIGGTFTTINNVNVNRLARLYPDGSLDYSFNPGTAVPTAGQDVRSLAFDSTGRLLVGGNFGSFAGSGKNYLVRLFADGTLDTTFTAAATGRVGKIIPLADGGLLATGSHNVSDLTYRLVRYNADGTIAYLALPSTYGTANDIALTPDGGHFCVAWSDYPFLYRLNLADGVPDPAFVLDASAPINGVYRLALSPDGKILTYGVFKKPYNYLARYLPTGALDPTFDPGTGFNGADNLFPLALDQAGRIWLGGIFTEFNGGTNNARILVLEGDVPALAWVRQPMNQSVAANANATFTVQSRVPQGASVAYQWHKNGSPLEASSRVTGVNSPTLTLRSVNVADEGLYTATAQTLVTPTTTGLITSIPGELIFLGAPEILTHPAGAVREAGIKFTLHVRAQGAGTLSYQWYRGTATTPTAPIVAATTANHTLAAPATTDTAYYCVKVTNSLGSVTTSPVLVTFSTPNDPGLPDTFDTFLATAGVPANQRGPLDDPDSDGLSNLLEYALGLAPNSTSPNSLPATVINSGNLTLTYRRAAADVTYTVETNTSLTNPADWTSAGVTQGTPDVNGNTTATIPATGPGQFLRLRITR